MDKSKQAMKARERKLRAKFRRRLRFAIIFFLIVGLAAGFVGGRLSAGAPINPFEKTENAAVTSEPTATPEATAEVTQVPVLITATPAPTATPEVTPEATSETAVSLPTAEPTVAATATPAPEVKIVPYGEEQILSVQAYSDGSVRKTADAEAYETVNFTLRVTRHLSNQYYTDTYGSTHRLVGNEAGVEFELLVNDYMGGIALDPNVLLKTTGLEDKDGNINLAYRFTDKEIAGEDKFTVETNVPTLLYKRYQHSEAQMEYMTVTTYVDGVPHVFKFDLGEPVVEPTATPEPVVYTTLRQGASGEEVKKLQERLIEMGYLAEGSADGSFGLMTYEAIRKVQLDLGLTVDGIAGQQFQTAIFSGN